MRPIPTNSEPFGLVAWLQKTRVSLPLKGVECRFAVNGAVANVELDQIYHQQYCAPLDCTYTFPLPDGAAVYRCELHVNGRVIRAIVRAQDEARRIYDAQKAAGRRASLVEVERPNIFTLTLGNLQPGDVVVVRLAYFQTLERGADHLRLRIPLCPGQRYIPGQPLLRSNRGRGSIDDTDQVPDASRISPPRIDAFHPDAAYFWIEGTLAPSDVAEDSLSSPTHPIVARLQESGWNLQLATNNAVPDRDLVVCWMEPVARTLEPRGWKSLRQGQTFALVQFRAPEQVTATDSYSQDIYFLVDRSGSMGGAKWEKTCEALSAFVELLGDKDRVWITLFESRFQDFAEVPLPTNEIRSDRAFQGLVKQGVTGGTEIVPAAKHVLDALSQHSRDRRAVIIIITDGEIGNDDEVLALFSTRRDVTVFTFGIDTAVNDALLKRLAAQHGGACRLQTPHDDIQATVAGLGARLRRPVVTQLRARGAWEAAPRRLPNLHAGDTIDLCLCAPDAAETIELDGCLPDGSAYSISVPLQSVGNEALPLLWAREHIAELELGNDRAAAIAVAEKYNLLCKGTAFVAWDEADRVAIATESLYQPAMEGAYIAAAAPCSVMYDTCCLTPSAVAPIGAAKRRALESIREQQIDPLLPFEGELREYGVGLALARRLAEWANTDRTIRNIRPQLLAALLTALRSAKGAQSAFELCEQFVQTHFIDSPLYEELRGHLNPWSERCRGDVQPTGSRIV